MVSLVNKPNTVTMNDFKSKEERRQERERQLQIMRSVAVELDPHQPGGRGSGASVGSSSTGSASTGAGSGSTGTGGSSRRGGRRSRTDGNGQQARTRRSRSADVANQIMRDAGMPVTGGGRAGSSGPSTPSRSSRRGGASSTKGDAASAMMAPRRRSADLTKEIEKSVNMSSSSNRSSIGLALGVLEKDVSERTAAEAAASGGKERPPRCEHLLIDDVNVYAWLATYIHVCC